MPESYGQFCPVAQAAEVLTERWTLLVLRELLMGSTRFNELQRGVPRMSSSLLSKRLREMERSGLRSRCCGGGGGAPVTDVPGKRRIPDIRMEDARATGAATLAVACPQCTVMLEGVVGPRPEVKDVAELLAEAVTP